MATETYEAQKILFVELGRDTTGTANYAKMSEIDFQTEDKVEEFKEIVTGILNPLGRSFPGTPTRPQDDRTGGRQEMTDLSINCKGMNREIIFYIPDDIGATFKVDQEPFELKEPAVMFNPRLYYMDFAGLHEIRNFPHSTPPETCTLAAFSFWGEKARRSDPNNYTKLFKILAYPDASLKFPGDGDIGHPGGHSS